MIDKNHNIIANTEILNFIRTLEPEYIYKLPVELIEYLSENSIKDDKEQYSVFGEDGEIKVSEEAEKILIYIYLEYFADEIEKKELIELYTKNEEELKEKYDIKTILQKRNK